VGALLSGIFAVVLLACAANYLREMVKLERQLHDARNELARVKRERDELARTTAVSS
jgi:hypothetical protein